MSVSILKGKILVYRFYEIGSEVDIPRAAESMQRQNTTRFRLERPGKEALVIADEPLTVHLGHHEMGLAGRRVQAEIDLRVWRYGGLSVCFHLPLDPGTTWGELVEFAHWIERDQEFDRVAWEKSRDFQQDAKSAIPVPNHWPTHEDYVIYYLQEMAGAPADAQRLFELVDVPALMMAEPKEKLSAPLRQAFRQSALQYAENDLTVIDWNSALVVDPSGSMDVPTVIEFANSQLLEMRYYDDLLDEKLDTLYKAVAGTRPGIFSNTYSRHAEEAGRIYLEIAEVVENVENSLKVVGDFYLATVFRAASARFRFNDWQKSINEKLGNMAEVSKLLHSRVSESRSHWLEIIIIALIAVELIPFIKGWF